MDILSAVIRPDTGRVDSVPNGVLQPGETGLQCERNIVGTFTEAVIAGRDRRRTCSGFSCPLYTMVRLDREQK